MKNKIPKNFQIINYIMSSQMFKAIFITTILVSLIGSGVLTGKNYIESILIAFQNPIFNIMIFTLAFLNTINACTVFDKKISFYIIRLKNKKNYMIEIIKNTIILTLIYLLILYLMYFMILNLEQFGQFKIEPYLNYGITNLTYVIFYLIKYTILVVLINVISALVYLSLKNKWTILIDSLFLIGFMLAGNDGTPIDTFSLNIWGYFGGIIFSSFTQEICFSILYILILEIICLSIFTITLKKKRLTIG